MRVVASLPSNAFGGVLRADPTALEYVYSHPVTMDGQTVGALHEMVVKERPDGSTVIELEIDLFEEVAVNVVRGAV